jgi:hypothetical protein
MSALWAIKSAAIIPREFDEPLPPSLPLGNGKRGATKNLAFAPLSVSERGWGRGQIILVELTLIPCLEKSVREDLSLWAVLFLYVARLR